MVFFALIILFMQTPWFRSILKGVIIDAANSALTARLEIDELDGSLFDGWDLTGVRLVGDDGPIVTVRRISLRYDIWNAPWKSVTIRDVTIVDPVIRIVRPVGGEWNIAHLVRDTTTSEGSSSFDWTITLSNLAIVNGCVLVFDSTTTGSRASFSPTHMALDSLMLACSGAMTPSTARLRIETISWANRFGDVSLRSLSGDILLGGQSSHIRDLALVTDRSQIRVSARLDSLDLLKPMPDGAFEHAPMEVALHTPSTDLRDVRYFLPALDFLGSTAGLDLDAAGTLNDLHIRTIHLRTGNSDLTLAGRLRNIPAGAEMLMDATITNSVIDPADLPVAMPGIPLPDYTDMGPATITLASYSGTPLAFESRIDVATRHGSARGTAKLDITGDQLVYDITVQAQRLDLAAVLGTPALSSAINADAHLQGVGFTPGTMRAHAELHIDSTRFQRWTVSQAAIMLEAVGDSLRLNADLRSHAGSVTARSMVTISRDSIRAFALNGDFRAVNLGAILGEDSLHSDLTGVLSLRGDGINPATASVDGRLMLAPGSIASTHLPADTMILRLDQRDPHARALVLNSGYGDVQVLGRFDIPRFLDWLSVQADSIAAGVEAFMLRPDSIAAVAPATRATGPRVRPSRMAAVDAGPDTTMFMDAQVLVNVKEFERIRRLLPHLITLRGGYRGSIRGGMSNMAMRGDVQISDLYYIDTLRKLTFLGAGLFFQHSIDSLSPTRPLSASTVRASFTAADARYNGMKFNRISTSVSLDQSQLRFMLRGRLDTNLAVALRGEGAVHSHIYTFSIPVLDVTWLGQAWSAPSPVAFTMDSGAITIGSLRLARGPSVIELTGQRRFDGTNALTLEIDSLLLQDVEAMLAGGRYPPKGKGFSGVAEITADISGSDDAPRLATDIFIPNLGYHSIAIGELSAEARYDNEMLELFSDLAYRTREGTKKKIFFASGNLPISLGARDTLAEQHDREADLRLQMKQFPLFLVEKFIRVFNPLNGEANADLSVRGSLPRLSYSGFLETHDAVGRLVYNNMTYRLALTLRPEESRIHIDTLLIRNDPADWEDGAITGTGMIDLDGFTLQHFTSTLEGRLKVLKRASRSTSRMVYGDLALALGGDGLLLEGGPAGSSMSGDLVVERGDLVFAMQEETMEASQNTNITYVVVDDTTKRKTTSLGSGVLTREGSLFGRDLETEADSANGNGGGLGTNLAYDLRLSTSGPLGIAMPFSAISQEELNAKLRIDEFRISNASGFGAFVGNVALTGDSYLMFLSKRFAASGSLSFTGDAANPDLDLRAVYNSYYTAKESNARRKVFVIVTIKGSKDKPALTFDMRWDAEDGEVIGSGGDSQSDAFSFILFGSFTSDLSGSEKGKVLDQAQNLSNALTSSMVSAAASEFINRVGLQDVIKRVDIGGIGTQAARIKVPIEIGRVVLIYDGQINSPGNSELVLEIPVGYGFIMATTFRTTVPTAEVTAEPQGPTTYEVKLLYRISF